jgi:hypothetical protein
MADNMQDSDEEELIESDLNDYGGTVTNEAPTKSLEEIYEIIGMYIIETIDMYFICLILYSICV